MAVSVLSRYVDRPTNLHCEMVKRVYRYLMANMHLGLHFKPTSNNLKLAGYSDASYANSYEARSMSGYALILSGSLISWYSRTQPAVAQTTAEAEYISLTDIAKEIVGMKLLLSELGYGQADVTVFEGNQAAIRLAKNPQDNKRTKHI